VSGPFDDLLDANRQNRESFAFAGLTGRPRLHLAVLACMDTRIDPLAVLGLQPGDAKILRNAGGRVTDDVVRSLAIVIASLGVDRVAVIAHTDCAMEKLSVDELRDRVRAATGNDAADHWDPMATPDQAEALRADMARLHADPLLPDDLVIGAFIYDVATGALSPLD
jgi:carbonic anhydrase